MATPLLARAQTQRATTGEKARLMDETQDQAASWSHPRRVVDKADTLDDGPPTRVVVTTRTDRPPRSTSGTSIGA